MSETTNLLVERAKKHLSGKEHYQEFVRELEALDFDEGAGYQGGPGTLLRMVSMQKASGRFNVGELYEEWARDREAATARLVRERYLNSTYEVAYAKGKRWGKPERIPKEDADKPWKPGMLLMDEKGRIEGHSFDSDFGPSFSLRSLAMGTETPAGVVKAKRQIRTEQGLRVQYLIKPWSASGKRKYDAKKRLQRLETALRTEVDMMSPKDLADTHKEIETLKKRFKL